MSARAEPPEQSERERQRAGVAWALADLEGLRARGIIGAETYTALRRDYEARLRWLDASSGAASAAPVPAEVTTELSVTRPAEAQAAAPEAADGAGVDEGPEPALDLAAAPPTGGAPEPPPIESPALSPDAERLTYPVPAAAEETVGPDGAGAVAGAAPPPVAAAPGRGSSDLWINVLLYLGAFFVVIAALIFVAYSWRQLGGVAKTGILAGFTLAFLAAGAVCLRSPRVRPAGHTFLAVGALLTPLTIVALHNFVLRERGLSGEAVWAWGSLACLAFYGALALGGLGRFYAAGAVLAAISAWVGAVATFAPPERAVPGLLMALPLALLAAGRLGERTEVGRAAFGAVPAVAAQLLVPLGIPLVAIYLAFGDDRWGGAIALGLAALFYAGAAASRPAGDLRSVQVAGALLVGSGFLLAAGYAARIPDRGYAALVLGMAWLALALGAWGARRDEGWGNLAGIIGWLHAGALLLPWSLFLPDRYAAYWTAIFAGLVLYTGANLWGRRSPWLLYPLALAAGQCLYHALRLALAPARPDDFAWGYAALALAPLVAVRVARQRGASRAWDAHLIAVGQSLAIVASALAAGDRTQLALVLWLFVAAAVAVVALERDEALLILPDLWGVAAVGATLRAAGVEGRWAPAAYAGVGLALALGLFAWRGVPGERRGSWFMAHRWSAGGWAALGPLLGVGLLGDALLYLLGSGDLLDLVLHPAYGPVGLATALCGAALVTDALVTFRRPTGYGSSAVLALAVLMGIARLTPNNPQAYAVPLGLYLLALSVYVAYERDLGPIRMPAANLLLAGAVVVILGTTFLQSLLHPWRYIFMGLAEGLALLGATLFLRRRYGVALSLTFLVLTALRALFHGARALPYWAVIGLLGLALLTIGLFVLLYRDRFEAWMARASARWAKLM